MPNQRRQRRKPTCASSLYLRLAQQRRCKRPRSPTQPAPADPQPSAHSPQRSAPAPAQGRCPPPSRTASEAALQSPLPGPQTGQIVEAKLAPRAPPHARKLSQPSRRSDSAAAHSQVHCRATRCSCSLTSFSARPSAAPPTAPPRGQPHRTSSRTG
jgi:hypothetical protein